LNKQINKKIILSISLISLITLYSTNIKANNINETEQIEEQGLPNDIYKNFNPIISSENIDAILSLNTIRYTKNSNYLKFLEDLVHYDEKKLSDKYSILLKDIKQIQILFKDHYNTYYMILNDLREKIQKKTKQKDLKKINISIELLSDILYETLKVDDIFIKNKNITQKDKEKIINQAAIKILNNQIKKIEI